MSHRPPVSPLLRLAPAGLLALAACRGGFQISPVSEAMTARTLLGCVAEVAEQSGLPVIEQHADAAEPTLWARSDSLDAPAATPRRVDQLTVSFKRLGRGLRVLAQTFDVRGPARDRALPGSPTTPSPRVAEARDAVLARCGSLGP